MNFGSHQCIFYLGGAQPMPTDIDDIIHSSCDLVVAVFGAVRPITRKILTYGMASVNTLRSTYTSDHSLSTLISNFL